ncbi:hypothetical protein ABW19_dt0200244 [Dactylella cylindrospora]|nr:hypothetical protein ABW19_dt0200244 [Dactylella cylindrospora]
MRFFSFAVLSGIAASALASPIFQITSEDGDISPLERRAPSAQVCKNVQIIVSILKLYKATPFCSSFLQIPTQTAFSTEVIPTTTTQTENTVVYTTVTIVAATNTASFEETETIATLPTVVETSVVPSVSVIVSTVTPPPVSVTTTVYTTVAAKRDVEVHEVEERGIKIPSFVAAFASSAISQACSCLSIPTPSVTRTITEYASNTAVTILTASSTDTALSTTETSVTSTIFTTLYVPTTTFTTSVSVSTSITTIATPTVTVTVNKPLPSACTNILSGNKLYTQGAPGRNIEFDTSENRRYFPERTEFTLGQCCAFIYESVPNASVFFFSDRGASAGAARYYCFAYLNNTPLSTGISAQCPLGVIGDNVSSVSGKGTTGFGLGPCYGNARVI